MADVTLSNGADMADMFAPSTGVIGSIVVSDGGTKAVVTVGSVVITYTGTGLTATGVVPTGGTVNSFAVTVNGIAKIASTFGPFGFELITLAVGDPNGISALFASLGHDIQDSTSDDTIIGGNFNDQVFLTGDTDDVSTGGGADAIRIASTDGTSGSVSFPAHQIDGGAGIDRVIVGNEFGADGVAYLFNAAFTGIEEMALEDSAHAILNIGQFGPGGLPLGLAVFCTEAELEIGHDAGEAIDLSGFTVNGALTLTISAAAGNERITGNDVSTDSLEGGVGNDTLRGLGQTDTLFGGAGDDRMDGGGGVDRLDGGDGNDIYLVNNGTDQVIEAPGRGRDSVFASASFALSRGVEVGVLTGRQNINMAGSADNNTITGNVGDNRLSGGAGADILAGGRGDDILTGGTGHDRFVFATGDDRDRINGFAGRGASNDRIDLSDVAAITGFADLKAHHMTQIGINVVINAGQGDVIVLADVRLASLDAGDFLF
jgi:Ca2+-binding RTX toxin-like protein